MNRREANRSESNNPDNTNKNICILEVAKALGCEDETRYLHTIRDLVYALRKHYMVRSRAAKTKGKSVGKIRDLLPAMANEVDATAFVVRVDGHILMLGTDGATLVDTDPRQRDRRKITHFYVVYAKDGREASTTPKEYYEQHGIGRAKYAVNYHNGNKTHEDGSPFYDLALFSNKKALASFIDGLKTKGYKER